MYPSPHLRVDRSEGAFDGHLYAIWAGDGTTQKLTEGMDIFFSRSTDEGATWSTPIILNNDDNRDLHQFHPSLHVNDQGIVIASWYDRREDPNNVLTKYYMTFSSDGGETFVDDFPVSTEAADFSMIGEGNANFGIGEYTQVIATDDFAIPFWADGRENTGDIDIYSANIPLDATTTSVENFQKITSNIIIDRFYPNPVRSVAQLDLTLQKQARVKVSINTLDGKKLRQVINRNLKAGNHQVRVKTGSIAQGVYLLKVESAIGVITKKFVVLE